MLANSTPQQVRTRLASDQLTMAQLDGSDCPVQVTGHRSAEDVRANRNPVPVGHKDPPHHYRVVYDFDTLRGPGTRARPTILHIAPMACGSYPATPPGSWVVSEFTPWTPHFTRGAPVCHGGHVWTPNRTLLVDYTIHLGKLLNFDEPPPAQGYHGYNPQAIAHWRDALNFAPLNPDLRFPVIHLEDVIRSDGFRTAQSDGRSRFASGATTRRFVPARSSRFLPAGDPS